MPRRSRRNWENCTNREERPKGEGVQTSHRGAAPAGGGRTTCAGQGVGGSAGTLDTWEERGRKGMRREMTGEAELDGSVGLAVLEQELCLQRR